MNNLFLSPLAKALYDELEYPEKWDLSKYYLTLGKISHKTFSDGQIIYDVNTDNNIWVCNGFWFLEYSNKDKSILINFTFIEKLFLWYKCKRVIKTINNKRSEILANEIVTKSKA